ncbi:hypothetical protein [Acidisoma sp. C75]
MTTPATLRLLRFNDAGHPALISRHLLAGAVRPEDCPWVKVGRLFLSVTITGQTSWLPLISRLYPEGMRRYTVFTGRHGNIPNFVDHSGRAVGIFDAQHLAEDEEVRAQALAEFSDITIDLVDSASAPRLQTQWLRRETTEAIRRGHAVIYAWCYGLFTMCEAPGDLERPRFRHAMQSHQSYLTDRTVAELVQDYWSWVPRPI